MDNPALWSVVLMLAVLTGGCGKGPDTTRPSQKATPPAEEATPAGAKVITNSIGMKLTLIPAGEFMMGSRESPGDTAAFLKKTYGSSPPADSFKHEHPQHRVRITKPFCLGTYHVTRGQFRQFVADTG